MKPDVPVITSARLGTQSGWAVIARVKGRSIGLRLRVSSPITGGHKLLARRGSTAQEVFVVTRLSRDQLQEAVDQLTS